MSAPPPAASPLHPPTKPAPPTERSIIGSDGGRASAATPGDAVRSGERGPPGNRRSGGWGGVAILAISAVLLLVALAGAPTVMQKIINNGYIVLAVAGLWIGALFIPGLNQVALFPVFLVAAPMLVARSRYGLPPSLAVSEDHPARLNAAQRSAMEARGREFDEDGFAYLGAYQMVGTHWHKGQKPKDAMLLHVYEHPTTHAVGVAMMLVTDNPVGPALNAMVRFVELVRRGGGSSEPAFAVGVMGERGLGGGPRNPRDHLYLFDKDAPVREYHAFQSALLRAVAPGHRARGTGGDFVRFFHETEAFLSRDNLESGRWVPAEGEEANLAEGQRAYRIAGVMRCTIQGWKLVPGVNAMLRARERARTRRMRERVGV